MASGDTIGQIGHHLLFFAQCAMAKYSETNYKQFQYKLEPARHKKPARRSAQNSIKSLSNFPITTKCCSCSHYPNHVWINSQLGFILSYSIFNWHYLPFYSAVPMTCHTQHSAKIIVATVSRTSRKSVNGRGNQPAGGQPDTNTCCFNQPATITIATTPAMH